MHNKHNITISNPPLWKISSRYFTSSVLTYFWKSWWAESFKSESFVIFRLDMLAVSSCVDLAFTDKKRTMSGLKLATHLTVRSKCMAKRWKLIIESQRIALSRNQIETIREQQQNQVAGHVTILCRVDGVFRKRSLSPEKPFAIQMKPSTKLIIYFRFKRVKLEMCCDVHTAPLKRKTLLERAQCQPK